MKAKKEISNVKPLTANEIKKIKQVMCKLRFKKHIDGKQECYIAADREDNRIIIVALFRDGFLNLFACDTSKGEEFDSSPTIVADDPVILNMLRSDTKKALLILINTAVLILQGKLKIDYKNQTVEFNDDGDDDLIIL
jgi:hypothetical protein